MVLGSGMQINEVKCEIEVLGAMACSYLPQEYQNESDYETDGNGYEKPRQNHSCTGCRFN
jgi:hypothetical protein